MEELWLYFYNDREIVFPAPDGLLSSKIFKGINSVRDSISLHSINKCMVLRSIDVNICGTKTVVCSTAVQTLKFSHRSLPNPRLYHFGLVYAPLLYLDITQELLASY